jgi:hypothetical protein
MESVVKILADLKVGKPDGAFILAGRNRNQLKEFVAGEGFEPVVSIVWQPEARSIVLDIRSMYRELTPSGLPRDGQPLRR